MYYSDRENRRLQRQKQREADDLSAVLGFLFCMVLILFLFGMMIFGPSIY